MNKTNQKNKRIAVQFLSLVIGNQIDLAYQKYVDMKGKHHNPFFPSGFLALQKGMKENEVQFPNKRFTVKNILGDGDLVAVHSHLVLKQGDTGLIVVHVFRFKNEKIIEMWDCGQPIPANSPNQGGAF